MILPDEALPLLDVLAPVFTQPTYQRFVLLMAAAVLTTGRRTVANLLRTLGPLATGHRTDYQRVFSRAPGPGLRLGCAMAGFLLRHLLPQGPVIVVGDDTVDGHPGRKVYGKARHRDPVRSSHSYTAWRYGHKWVVLAVLVRLPCAARPWALPVPVDLYRSEEDDRRRRRPHRTPAQLMCRLLRPMLLRFPGRTFVFVGDAGYGTHEVARFCRRHRTRLTLVSKLHPDANPFEPPPPYAGHGRPRVKGRPPPKPRQAAAVARRRRTTVGWYGGGRRRVEVVTATGCWYKSGRGVGAPPLGLRPGPDRHAPRRSTSSLRTRRGDRRRSSATTRPGGTSRPPSRSCAATWGWRRLGVGPGARCCGPPPACSGCTRSSPCCSPPCPKPSGRQGFPGRGRPALPSPTP